jgi:hypothetical protein
MASALYVARFVAKEGATVQIRLTLVHPDVSEFGTDRLWGWKLLYDWVSPPDDGDAVAMAGRYVRSVAVSPVEHGRITGTEADFIQVARTDEEDPVVVYTIEVTDAALLGDIQVGDEDEVYDFVEPGRGKALKKPPRAKKAPSADQPAAAKKRTGARAGKQAPAELSVKSYSDVRQLFLQGLKKYGGGWSDYVVDKGFLSRWAQGAADAEVKGWLAALQPMDAVAAAALLGLDRLRQGQVAAAQDWLQLAESGYRQAEDYSGRASGALAGLWWRLGQPQKAEAALAWVEQAVAQFGALQNQSVHTLVTVLARGGRWAEVLARAPQVLNGGTYREDLLIPGVLLAWEDSPAAFTALMSQWTETLGPGNCHRQCYELSLSLLRLVLQRGEPEKYLEQLLRFPQVLDGMWLGRCALLRTETQSPALAVELAARLADVEDLHPYLLERCLAVLMRHAPSRAAAWVARDQELWREHPSLQGYLMAAGQVAEPRAQLAAATSGSFAGIAWQTSERGLAVEALKKTALACREPNEDILLPLLDLGERAFVDEVLQAELQKISGLPTKQRDIPCRGLARAAAQLGRADLAFAAVKLPGPAVRQYAASSLAAGAAAVGDFTTAYAALQLVPDDNANGRVSAALQSGLVAADESFIRGPRAVPLAVLDAGYVDSLIAAGDRAGVAWLRAIHGGKLPAAVQARIEAFLATAGGP